MREYIVLWDTRKIIMFKNEHKCDMMLPFKLKTVHLQKE